MPFRFSFECQGCEARRLREEAERAAANPTAWPGSKICPNCQYRNHPENEHCDSCGQRL